ncbi:37089_t:CDS:2 [Racocetra persica]|uniref:37089_t:CDS:1 n=1 Tax=Racocetra persica TaxID=160502 RepID=A0ACA9KLI4_9GLOM|nr:37089_t:CDS:2 [Racocetra persica]
MRIKSLKSLILSIIFAIAIFNTLTSAQSYERRLLTSGSSYSSLKPRQSCQPNSYKCPNGPGCCPVGETCLDNDLCSASCTSTSVPLAAVTSFAAVNNICKTYF